MLALSSIIASSGFGASRSSLIPPVALPNGEEFKTWEVPLSFSRTYHVDQRHPKASNRNPGTLELPFRTINHSAQMLQPGERVVVAAGVYRERVSPARGGTGPHRMISYEAAPGAEVIMSGSQFLKAKWKPSKQAGQAAVEAAWMTQIPEELFDDERPFTAINLTDEQIDRCMPWAVPIKGHPTLGLRRGLVFQDGRRLRQVAQYAGLGKQAGSYYVEANGRALHVRPFQDGSPAQARFEVTTRGMIFAPRTYGLGYLRVKGFTIEHSGNGFPRPQQGALSAQRGHHWMIEENTVRQCNAIGIDIGDQFATDRPELAEGGQHLIRRNRVLDCGVGGIEGKQIEHTLIEDNVIRRCGWHNIWPLYETAGIKVHCTQSCVLRRNLVTDTIGAPGIWLDYANVNSRCTGNVIVNTDCANGGIFMEASQQPNLVDNNFVWGARGTGIYQHDCDELIIAHNLVANSSDAAVRMKICQGRKVGGRLTTARRNRILNNVFINNGAMLDISDPDNVSDGNVFAGSRKPFELAAWQRNRNWDRESVVREIQVAFDAKTLEFRWSPATPLPRMPVLAGITQDVLGKPRLGPKVLPGPFATDSTAPAALLPHLTRLIKETE